MNRLDRATDALIALVRAFGAVERDAVCCGDVTVAQCIALQALRDGPLEVHELANATGTSRAATSRMVDGLHGRGWVDRTRDDADRRRVAVSLTEDGVGQAEVLRARTREQVERVLTRVPAHRHDDVLEAMEILAAATAGERCC